MKKISMNNTSMKNIWNWIDSKNWNADLKFRMIVFIITAASAVAGLCVWSIIRSWALDHWSWMLVFAGYPAFISFVLVIIYSLKHSFHNGAHEHESN